MAEQTRTNNVPNLLQINLPDGNLVFNDVISTATLPSSELEKNISDLFGGAFDDFEGCKIEAQGNMGESLKCKLYFKPNMSKSDEGSYAVKVRGEISKNKPSSFSDMINTVNMLQTSKQFELEDIAKEILAEFLVIPNENAVVVDRYSTTLGKVVKVRLPKNWNPYTAEVVDQIQNTRFQNPYLVVTLELPLIVARMYGKKDEEEVKTMEGRVIPKDRYQYQVNIVRVINPTMKSYILEVRRMDINEINKLARSIGYGMVSGSIVMTRR